MPEARYEHGLWLMDNIQLTTGEQLLFVMLLLFYMDGEKTYCQYDTMV